MKHLKVLEEAGLVTARKVGREHHFLNPVPIRLIHDRWIASTRTTRVGPGRPQVLLEGAFCSLVGTAAAEQSAATTQVYDIFIKANPEAVFDAITKPSSRAATSTAPRSTSRRTPTARTGPMGRTGAVARRFEFDPPRRVVHEWRSGYDPTLAAETASRVTWEITPGEDGISRLTVT